MRWLSVLLAATVLAETGSGAEPVSLAFRPAGKGLFDFDTGPLRGRLKVDGKYQGLYPLVDAVTGGELVHAPGVFSFYRVFEENHRYGNGHETGRPGPSYLLTAPSRFAGPPLRSTRSR